MRIVGRPVTVIKEAWYLVWVRPHPSSSVLYRFVRFLESSTVFFLVSVLLTAALFVLGNVQEFLDESLTMLIDLLVVFSTLGVTSGLCYVVALLVWMIRRHHVMAGRFALGVAATAIALVAAVGAGALGALVSPG